MSHQGKYRDPLPDVPRAGIVVPEGNRAKTCLEQVSRPPTPPVVRKFRTSIQPEPGAITVHRGIAGDPDIANTLVHGISTKTNDRTFFTPVCKTSFQEKLEELSETVYASKKTAPLGRSHDQSSGLPDWYNDETSFGIEIVRGLEAHEVLNPKKTMEELEMEAQVGHEKYVRSHSAYFAGEQVDRNYDWSLCSKDSSFGIPTPHFSDGRSAAKNILWLGESTKFYNPKPRWKRPEDSGEKLAAQMGKVNPKKGDTLNLPEDHTFGIILPLDECGVAEVIHSMGPGEFAQGRDAQRCLVNAVRHHLKRLNYHNFPSLLQAFRSYDKEGKGAITKDNLQEMCCHFKLEVSGAVLDDLMRYCDADGDGVINFMEFANFLNWKDKMPLSSQDQQILTNSTPERRPSSPLPEAPPAKPLIEPEDLQPAEPGSSLRTLRNLIRPQEVANNFNTSSSLIGSVTDRNFILESRSFGIPSVRSDLPVPRLKRVSDYTNYGDIPPVVDIVFPSVPALRGVYDKDFTCPRTKKEMMEIFKNLVSDISEDTLEEAWNLASTKHPAGEVCVEAFRDVLKEIKAL